MLNKKSILNLLAFAMLHGKLLFKTIKIRLHIRLALIGILIGINGKKVEV